MEDMWPEDLEIPYSQAKSPVTILGEQASLLGRRTKNVVEAEVEREDPPEYLPTYFQYAFYIVGPVLSRYRYRLFRIVHDVNLYPVSIEDLDPRISSQAFGDAGSSGEALAELSDVQFVSILRAILRSQRTRDIIDGIRKQSGVMSEGEQALL